MAGRDYRELVLDTRARLGLTQPNFAKLLGVHRSTIAEWEAGRAHPSRRYLIRLDELAIVARDKSERRQSFLARVLGAVEDGEGWTTAAVLTMGAGACVACEFVHAFRGPLT